MGRDREQVGAEATGGEADERDSQQRHDNEMKMVVEKCATQIPFPLSQCDVPTLEECGSMCELCTVMCARENFASARIQVGVVFTNSSEVIASRFTTAPSRMEK